MRPSRPVADHLPTRAGRSPTRKLTVQIVPVSTASEPGEPGPDFVSAIGDLLIADWLASHVSTFDGRNLTVGGTGANTRPLNAADEEPAA